MLSALGSGILRWGWCIDLMWYLVLQFGVADLEVDRPRSWREVASLFHLGGEDVCLGKSSDSPLHKFRCHTRLKKHMYSVPQCSLRSFFKHKKWINEKLTVFSHSYVKYCLHCREHSINIISPSLWSSHVPRFKCCHLTPVPLIHVSLKFASGCARASLGWISRITSLQKGLLSTGIGSPRRWLSPETFGCGAQGHDLVESS